MERQDEAVLQEIVKTWQVDQSELGKTLTMFREQNASPLEEPEALQDDPGVIRDTGRRRGEASCGLLWAAGCHQAHRVAGGGFCGARAGHHGLLTCLLDGYVDVIETLMGHPRTRLTGVLRGQLLRKALQQFVQSSREMDDVQRAMHARNTRVCAFLFGGLRATCSQIVCPVDGTSKLLAGPSLDLVGT